MSNNIRWSKPEFNSPEENYAEYIEYIRTALTHRHATGGALPVQAWRKLIREQIAYARTLRVKCDPDFLIRFHMAIRG